MHKIHVIIGSTRPNRASERIAKWLFGMAKAKGMDVELVDLRDYPLPFYQEVSGIKALKGNYSVDIAKQWAAKVKEADGFLIVSPEYNHGYSAVLKNALDYVFDEWNGKPVAFASYGGIAGGTRAVQQLRQVVIELLMIPLRDGVHLPFYPAIIDEQGTVTDDRYLKMADTMLASLQSWTEKLKKVRD